MIRFSDKPGARERHLQRMQGNPLFATEKQEVTRAQLEEAQRLDTEELLDFQQHFQSLLQEAMSLDDNVESDVILKLKEKIDRYYEWCSGLAGDQGATRAALKKLVSVIMRVVWKAAENDPLAIDELEQEEEARQMHYALQDYSLISDLLRPDNLIDASELVPVLLTGPVDAACAALQLFEAEQRAALCQQARALLSELQQQYPEGLTQAWQYLTELEAHAISQPAAGNLN